ncbi:MAG: Quinone oxidoreductase 1 [Alphaproteobacteria bacterium MarineAlpha5_Bin11]|nr:MAG: Quinone oxidoreductase 1 [Alphaproteobacteria bacterium MarineAlpha5_Bin11]PPR51844.1 MAG: Quinone oxidoreductase 1 [Alphaproteobacteria bacterium MarineAlpha5_Bin10]
MGVVVTGGVRVNKTGGFESMVWENVPLKDGGPGSGEVRIKHTAIGVNYIDTYHRSGIYPVELPCFLGLEAVGRVIAVGSGVDDFKTGDRVGYASGPIGAYCEERDFPSDKTIKIPDFIDDESAASILLKGMTVEYLFNRTYKIKKGELFLFHAAAGGVGLLACQWASAIGAKMIGTVGSDEKVALVRNSGCEVVVNYNKEDVAKIVMDKTSGAGVSVGYDGVGKNTFQTTIDCLGSRGLFVSFGQSSGMIPDVSLHKSFAPKNLYYTRPSLLVYNKTKKELELSSGAVFEMIKKNKISVGVGKRYKLKDAATAHKDLQSRKTTGSLILIP